MMTVCITQSLKQKANMQHYSLFYVGLFSVALFQEGPPCPFPADPPGGSHAVGQHQQLTGHH